MSDKRQLSTAAVATIRKPRAVLVGGAFCARVAEQLSKLDWEAVNVPASDELTCAIMARKPSVVVLPVDTGWESGYLVAAKLRAAKRKLKVVLILPTRTPKAERFAKFVGATLVTSNEGTAKLINAVTS